MHALANLDVPGATRGGADAGRPREQHRARAGHPGRLGGRRPVAVRGRPAGDRRAKGRDAERTLYAIEGVSAGFHAAARHRYNGKNSADLVAGIRALAAELHGFRPRTVALYTDGTRCTTAPAAQVFLSNLPFFGFGFHVDPIADPADGRLEAIVLEAPRAATSYGCLPPRATAATSSAPASPGPAHRAARGAAAARRRRPAAGRHDRRDRRRRAPAPGRPGAGA